MQHREIFSHKLLAALLRSLWDTYCPQKLLETPINCCDSTFSSNRDNKFQPIRRQDWDPTQVRFQAGEGEGPDGSVKFWELWERRRYRPQMRSVHQGWEIKIMNPWCGRSHSLFSTPSTKIIRPNLLPFKQKILCSLWKSHKRRLLILSV